MFEPDRAAAIRIAIGEAKPGDIVLLAGKGHEKVQVLGDRTIPFDDAEVARRVLAQDWLRGKSRRRRDEDLLRADRAVDRRGDAAASARSRSRRPDIRSTRARLLPESCSSRCSGERFDGHDFVEAALTRGAGAAVVSRDKLAALAGARSAEAIC